MMTHRTVRNSRTVLAFAALLCTFQLARAADWPSWRMDATLCGHTKTILPARPRLLWRTRIGQPIETAPVAMNGRLYVTTSQGTVACVDLDGGVLWKRTFTNDSGKALSFSSSALCNSNTVFVCSDEGRLSALVAESGLTRWSTELDATVLSPPELITAASGTRLYVMDQPSGTIHCVQTENGHIAWTADGDMRTDGPLAIADDRIVFGSCDSMVHILSRTNGTPIGTIELGAGNEMSGGIALSAGQAFTGNRSGAVICADMDARRILWTHADAAGSFFTTPAVSNDRIVVATGGGDVLCLQRADGRRLWATAFDRREPQSPIIAGQRVIVSIDGALVMLGLSDGKELWRKTVSDTISPPAIAYRMLIVGTDEGDVLAFGEKENP